MEDIRQDQEVVVIEKELTPIEVKVNGLIVTDEGSAKLATDYGVAISTYLKKLEERRKFLVQPLVDGQRRINSEFKGITERFEAMKEALKGKLLSYRDIVESKARAKQEKMNKMAKENGLPEIEKSQVENAVKSSVGQSFSTKRWTWKVVDEDKIPREFFIVDELQVNKLMRAHQKVVAGVSSMDLKIEGIEFFQEENISFKR